MGRPLPQEAAFTRVGALGVLAHDRAVEPAAVERAQVHIEVELEAQTQEEATLEHARRHVGRAHRAEEDGIDAAQLVEHRVGQHLAGAQVARPPEVVVDGLDRHRGGAHDLQGLGQHFGADAVAADDADSVGHLLLSIFVASCRR